MTIHEKISNFAEIYSNAFFVASLTEKKTLYVNKRARELFAIQAETCDFTKIFCTSNHFIRSVFLEDFPTTNESFLEEYIVTKADGTNIRVDLQIGYFDEDKTEIYLEMIEKKDMSKEMSVFQVDKSLKPEAIVELDDSLTLFYCNTHFFDLFGSTKQSFPLKYQCKLTETFSSSWKDSTVKSIHQTLKEQDTYKTELQIDTEQGTTPWISLQLQKRKINGSDKLMAYLSNIDEKVEIIEKYSTLEQYARSHQRYCLSCGFENQYPLSQFGFFLCPWL